jgi:hypothetical protein
MLPSQSLWHPKLAQFDLQGARLLTSPHRLVPIRGLWHGATLMSTGSKWFAAGALVGICTMLTTVPASAYRPFDGTDAAVADFGEVEIELQPIGAMRAGSTTKPISDSVLNFGFADRWELVLQGTAQAPPEGGGPLSVPDAAFLKYVVQPGVLQDKPGPSMAMEFGPLLPDVGGSGVGFSWSGIISQRWEWGTVHLNVSVCPIGRFR